MLKNSFPPIADKNTRVLVLGSLPGEASLARAQYYAHPRNQFWRLASSLVNSDLMDLSYADRVSALLSAGIGLWDVIGTARRPGSLDSSIRDHASNDLSELIATLPHLQAVAFNGGKASLVGRKQLDQTSNLAVITLPSSSPAHTLGFVHKEAEWLALQAFLKAEQQ